MKIDRCSGMHPPHYIRSEARWVCAACWVPLDTRARTLEPLFDMSELRMLRLMKNS